MNEFVAPAAWAAAAGAATLLISRRALRGGSGGGVLGAAAARGLAVALAVFAAFGPVTHTETRVPGVTLLASPDAAETRTADATLRWPGDAPDAAAALETLRATRDASRPAVLALAGGNDAGRARDLAAAAAGLRADDALDRGVIALPVAAARTAPGPAPRILAPAGATAGVPFILTLDSGSEPFAASRARVEIDGRATEFEVPRDARRATTPPQTLSPGSHLVVVSVEGRLPAATFVDVAGVPRVVVVSNGATTPGFSAMLRAQGITVVETDERELRAATLDAASSIVLGPGATGGAAAADVAARVRSGTGLLVLGGERTAGLSRFRGTAIEALLPVVVPPPPPPPPEALALPPPPPQKPDPAKPRANVDEGDKEALRVALLLVIDTSGSMSGTKLLMAQQAAIAAASSLASTDRVGVIAFDDDAHEVAPMQDAVALQGLARRVGALRANGGTNFFPALKLGYQRLLAERCGIRHVILLTDGETRPAVFRDLVESGAAANVTLSTIAVGDDANTSELARLASWGRGKLYFATDPARLPEVVTLDTQRFTTQPRDRAARERRDADATELPAPPAPEVARRPDPTPTAEKKETPAQRPRVVSMASLLAGLETARWPAMPFAESPAARAASQVVLAWDDGSPAMTLGRAGLGRVAVVAAGIASDEAREFHRWETAPQFLAQTIRSLTAAPEAAGAPVEVWVEEADDGRAFVRVAAPGGGRLALGALGGGWTLATSCEARGDASVAELSAMPPAGVYAGTFGAARAVVVSPGPRPLHADAAARIARASGTPLVDAIPSPRDGEPVRREEPAGLAFVALAAVMLVVESAFRRAARAG